MCKIKVAFLSNNMHIVIDLTKEPVSKTVARIIVDLTKDSDSEEECDEGQEEKEQVFV